MSDSLKSFSSALAALAQATAPGLVTLHPGTRAQRSALLWQPGILVTSEQNLPDAAEVPAILPGGARATATLAGRDPGTNVAALRVDLAGPALPPRWPSRSPGRWSSPLARRTGRPRSGSARCTCSARPGTAWRMAASTG